MVKLGIQWAQALHESDSQRAKQAIGTKHDGLGPWILATTDLLLASRILQEY